MIIHQYKFININFLVELLLNLFNYIINLIINCFKIKNKINQYIINFIFRSNVENSYDI